MWNKTSPLSIFKNHPELCITMKQSPFPGRNHCIAPLCWNSCNILAQSPALCLRGGCVMWLGQYSALEHTVVSTDLSRKAIFKQEGLLIGGNLLGKPAMFSVCIVKGSYYAGTLSSKLLSCKQRSDERPECHTSVHRCGKNIIALSGTQTTLLLFNFLRWWAPWSLSQKAQMHTSEWIKPCILEYLAVLFYFLNYYFHSCCSHFYSLQFSGCKIYSHLLQLLLVTVLLIILARMIAQLLLFFHKTSLGTEMLVLMTVENVFSSYWAPKISTLEHFSL